MAALAGVALVVAVVEAERAVRAAELELLDAETTTAARLLRDPQGAAACDALFGPRWARSATLDPTLFETTIETTEDPAVDAGRPFARGRALVLDADGWDGVGQVLVDEDVARRRHLPRALWALVLAAIGALLVIARRVAWRAATRDRDRAAARDAAGWMVAAGLIVLLPVALAGRWAVASLTESSDHRMALALRALATADDPERLAARPSGVQDLTGLRFVRAGLPLDRAPATTPPAASSLAWSGLPPEVAESLARAEPVTRPTRVAADRVAYVVGDAGPIRLVFLPYEHTGHPAARMAAVAIGGVLVGAPLLVLAAAASDRRRLRRELTAWSFLAPGLLHLLAFTVGPLVSAAWLSFHRWSLVDVARPFVGLDNYRALGADAPFWNALANTLVFALHVPVSMAVALGLALLVRRRGTLSTFARAAYFLPSITSVVAVAMVWQWMLNDEYGLANAALSGLGLPRVAWLSSPAVALVSVMLVAVWTTVGFQTVLFQAGLTAIPRELYEAARIDGARGWHRFRHVTLPGLRPTTFFVLVTSLISSFQVFGLVYVMTEGGPLRATDVAVFHIYEQAWELQRVGSAAAMSWVLFAVIFLVTLAHFRVLERRAA
jgi:ABC-type sugar transport system permease subunit